MGITHTIFATNDDVYNHNKCCFRSLCFPITHRVVSRVRNNFSTKEDEEQFEVDMIILVRAMDSGGDFRGLWFCELCNEMFDKGGGR